MDSIPELAGDEVALWHAFKRAADAVTGAVEREILEASGLTGAEFGVLDRLRLSGGAMRQVVLARSLGWQKSRLSHQLSRMQDRDLVLRQTSSPSHASAEMTSSGSDALRLALPAHARAVRSHLVEAFPPEMRDSVTRILLEAAASTQ